MAPSRERGGGPASGQQRPQGQSAGGRGGGRGPHGGGRGPNPNASATKKAHDNGNVQEKVPQAQYQSQSGSVAAAEQPKPGPWGSGVSFKDKLLAPKQEPAPVPPPAAAPIAKDSAAKPAISELEVPKPVNSESSGAAPAAPAATSPRPYAVAVSTSTSGAGAEAASDIQFGSFKDGEVAPNKESAAPQRPLPTAMLAAVEAVRQQNRQVVRTNSAPASANPAQEGPREAPVFIPVKVERAAPQPSRMAVASSADAVPVATPVSQAQSVVEVVAPPVAPAAPAPPAVQAIPLPVQAAPPPPREPVQQRQAPSAQGGPAHSERLHGRQGGHDRQVHAAGAMPYAHAAGMPMHPAQPAAPGQGPRHGHPAPPPPQHQQGFGPGPAHPPQPPHHHMQQQPQQPGGQRGGGRGGPAPQQVPVQVPVPVPNSYPQPPTYGMQPYGHQPSAPVNMAQPQHGYPAVSGQHGHMSASGPGQHGMPAPPAPPYVVGSPSQYQQYMGGAAFFPAGAVLQGQAPVTIPVMVPMASHPHHHTAGPPHGAPPHMLATSPNMSIGFHVPPPQQLPAPSANFNVGPAGPQPTPMGIPMPPPGSNAGSGAPNAPVAVAAQAAINATNAAAPVSAVPAVVQAVQAVHPPPANAAPASPAPAPVPAAVPTAAAAVAGAAASAPPAAAAPPSATPPPKAASTPPPPPAKKVLKIMDPSSHKEVNLAGSGTPGPAGAGEGKAPDSVSKPAAALSMPAKKVLEIKEPTSRPKHEHKAVAGEAKPVEPKPVDTPRPAEPARVSDSGSAAPGPAEETPQPVEAALAAPPAAEAPVLEGPAPKAPEAPVAGGLPSKEPASFQIDVADEEEAELTGVSAAPVAAPAAVAAPQPPAAAAPPPPAEEAAAPSASSAASGSGSGDDSTTGPSATTAGCRKKNLKQTLRDAETKGVNNDLLSVYREPTPAPKQEAAEPPKTKEVAAEEPKAPAPPVEEVTEHWEERADEAVVEEASGSGSAGAADSRHRYSRDYLLSIGTRIIVPLPKALDPYFQLNIVLDKPQDNTRIGAGMTLGRTGSREMDWGRGRDDRGRSGEFRGDMRGDRGGAMGGDRRDRGGDVRGGAMPGRGGMGVGMDRRGSANMDDGWQRRGPPPPPSPGGDLRSSGIRNMSRQGSGTPSAFGGPVNLHRSENRWQVGVSTAEDPEEEKKQKTFKGILNKLTPDNYDKLKQQILAVPITHQKTLEGFINQIFDKALTETTFSEMYANLCKEIHPSLPQFPSADGPNAKPVDFRRLLLNKCQLEFEDGVAAMKKVKEREEHNKEEAEKQGKEKAAGADNGKLEEGEIPPAQAAATDDARAKAQAEAAEAERELKARRRMLGNIQFIGHLYKCGLLTERIIHSCIVALLNEEQSPRPDDIECLCKLLTTLGKQLEEQVQKKGVANGNPLEVYFMRMERLRKSSNLDSRIKFAIQDVLDLRAAKWVSRRKVEGPKRIEDVHREAQAQMAAQASRDREERYNQRAPGGRGGPGMGGRDAPPPPGRFGGAAPQDEARLMGRGEVARPLRGAAMERQASAEVSLRPSFLMGKRTGSSPQPGGVIAAAAASAREAAAAAVRAPVPMVSAAPAPPPLSERPSAPTPAAMSDEAAKKKGASWVKELYEVKDKADAVDALTTLKAAGAPLGVVLSAAIREAFEVRGIVPEQRLDLLKEVLVQQLTATDGILNSSMLEDAFGRFMGELHTWVEDNPKAAGVAAKAVGELAAQGHISLGPCVRPILEVKGSGAGADDDEGGSDPDLPPLVESDVAGREILAGVLQAAAALGSSDKAAELWRASGLEAAKFFAMPEDVEDMAKEFPFLSS